ncbi:MAG: class IV adenylate cyclase [Anaerolineae bacterium]|nr:class IV adenylate cyclase [Anaerolineae bacterium]
MSHRLEIEVKFILDDPDAMRSHLLQLGAASHGKHTELNIRLDDDQGNLGKRLTVLRVRHITSLNQTSSVLTVKTPVQSSDPALSTRREIELSVGSGPEMIAALEVLGYKPYLSYEKRREIYSLDDVEVVIDELPFGWFAELEGEEDTIRALSRRLNFDLAESLSLSYAECCQIVRQKLGLSTTEMTFEALKDTGLTSLIFHEALK